LNSNYNLIAKFVRITCQS